MADDSGIVKAKLREQEEEAVDDKEEVEEEEEEEEEQEEETAALRDALVIPFRLELRRASAIRRSITRTHRRADTYIHEGG